MIFRLSLLVIWSSSVLLCVVPRVEIVKFVIIILSDDVSCRLEERRRDGFGP